jgi:cell division protein FtsB
MRYKRRTILSKLSNKLPKIPRKKNSKMRYLALIIIILFLLFNARARNLFSLISDKRTLTEKVAEAQNKNSTLKAELHNLETDPDYLERTIRGKLGLISPGEIEYRIKKTEKNK